jgi:lactose/L-arabinose transport system substrate-binding protein
MNNGAVGTYLPATKGDAYSTADEFFGGDAIYEDLAVWSEAIPVINIGSYTYEADAAVMAQMDAFILGDLSLEEALDAAQKQLEGQIQ